MSDWKASDEPRKGDDPIVRRLGMASEAITLVMACLVPWAYGAVDEWAETALDAGVVLLAILGLGIAALSGNWRRMASVPSVLLAGLVVLALAQAAPLPTGLPRILSPATASLREGLAPSVPQAVGGDPGPGVAPPSSTLSLDPDATRHAAAQLAAAWVLFQCVLLGHGNPEALRRFARPSPSTPSCSPCSR